MALCLWALGASGLCGACAGGSGAGKGASTLVSVPETLDARSFATLHRTYVRMALDDPQRPEVRAKLARYLLQEGARAHVADEYEAAVERLAEVSALYRPEELTTIEPAAAQLADYLRKRGEPRGDEARVLSALWLQKTLRKDDPEPAEQYALLRRWSDEARRDLGGIAEHLSGLIDVMAEHARLTPAPEVLATLSDLYAERRTELVAVLSTDGKAQPTPGELSFQDYRTATVALSRAPLDIAAVYLRHGDYQRALSRLRQLDTVTGFEPRIRTAVELVANNRAEAPEALLALSRAYLDAEDPGVAKDVCTYGVRQFPAEARFAQCLGQLAAARDDYGEAAFEYGEAIRLSPESRELYDEALEVLANLIRGELLNTDPTETRQLAERARKVLEERTRRFPAAPSPVSLEQIELAVGLAEMGAGNADVARQHFEKSLKKRETTSALVQIGQLCARLGEREDALRYLRRALERTSERNVEELRQRAQILEQLGDVMRAKREREPALRAYAEALAGWENALGASDDGPVRAFTHIRRGVLLSRLERDEESAQAFELAMQAAPEDRETYAQILAHLAVSTPAPELAVATLRRAQRQLTLEPEWKSYFALWVQSVSARGRQPFPDDLSGMLTRLSRSDAWWGHLAQFGLGFIDHARLSALARSRGERTEADFYEGTRRLAKGDVSGARQMFDKVIASRMVGFYEYQMAQELMLLDDTALLPPQS